MASIDSTHFQLQKTYTAGSYAFVRKISKPVAGTLTILDSTNAVVSPWTLDATTGIVTFPGATSGPLYATCEFDVPVRFDTDTFTLSMQLWNVAEIQSLNIIELLL